MLTSRPLYSEDLTLFVVFDLADPKQAELLDAFRVSFGEEYAVVEELVPTHYCALSVLPGGAREVQR